MRYFMITLPVQVASDPDGEWLEMKSYGISKAHTNQMLVRDQLMMIKYIVDSADAGGFIRADPTVTEISEDDYHMLVEEVAPS